MSGSEEILRRGIAHHERGELKDAARCYRDVLAVEPANPDALRLMAELAVMAGQIAMAVDLAVQAVTAAPDFLAHMTLGSVLRAAGRAEEAAAVLDHAVRLDPGSAVALSNLSDALNELGRHDDALDAAIRAVALDPGLAGARINFGNALLGLGSPEEAAEAYGIALGLDPAQAAAHFNLGNALSEMGEWDAAADSYRAALALEERPEWLFNLGNALAAAGQSGEAEQCYRRAVTLAPGSCDAAINLANLLVAEGRLEEAQRELAGAAARVPGDPEPRFNRALVLLRQGRMEEGWREYECRWDLPSFQPYLREFGVPAWTGGALDGRVVLIHAEQGFGDALMMARLVPKVADLGGTVVLECRPSLERLFATLDPRIRVVPIGAPRPAIDLHLPMMSLPAVLGLTLGDLPGPIPYLRAPEPETFGDIAAEAGLKVGLVWAGSATRRADARRSLDAADLAPLAALDGVAPFSLQVGGARPPEGVIDLAPRLRDFADTAAALTALDVVVTVDTAVAHLAGALGRPVLVMLSRPCDGFLWMEDRADTQWYPSARLFRQKAAGDWDSVIAAVAASLGEMK